MTESQIKSLLLKNSQKELYYTVKEGDTLRNIAFRIYNDVNGSQLITYFNDILNDDDLFPGMQIFLPYAEDNTYFDFYEAYGIDFTLDGNGNLTVNNNGDIETISGIKNIMDAVRRRLNTDLRTYLRSIDYGVNLFIGKPQKKLYFRLLRIQVVNALLQDDRITSAEILELDYEKTQIRIDVSLVTQFYDNLRFSVRISP